MIHDQPDAMAPARRPLRNSNPSHARDRRAATPVASVGISLPRRDRACLARFRKPRASSRGREIWVIDRNRTGIARATFACLTTRPRPPYVSLRRRDRSRTCCSLFPKQAAYRLPSLRCSEFESNEPLLLFRQALSPGQLSEQARRRSRDPAQFPRQATPAVPRAGIEPSLASLKG